MRLSERIYRMLLKAYPEPYRREYEEPMAQLFSDQLRAADTRRKLAALWLSTLADFLRTMPARYAEKSRHSLYGLENAQGYQRVPWSSSVKKSVFFARYEAGSFARKMITTEDLLMGLLREDRRLHELVGGAAAVEQIRHEIQSHEATRRCRPLPQDLCDVPLNAAASSAIQLAKEEAPRFGAVEATPRHLLAGILQQEQTLAAQLLRRAGVNLERLRSAKP